MRDLKQQGTGVTPSSRGQAMSPDHDVKQQRLFRTPRSRGKLRHQAPENRRDSGGRGQTGLQAVKVIQDIRRQRTVGTSNSRGKGNSGHQTADDYRYLSHMRLKQSSGNTGTG